MLGNRTRGAVNHARLWQHGSASDRRWSAVIGAIGLRCVSGQQASSGAVVYYPTDRPSSASTFTVPSLRCTFPSTTIILLPTHTPFCARNTSGLTIISPHELQRWYCGCATLVEPGFPPPLHTLVGVVRRLHTVQRAHGGSGVCVAVGLAVPSCAQLRLSCASPEFSWYSTANLWYPAPRTAMNVDSTGPSRQESTRRRSSTQNRTPSSADSVNRYVPASNNAYRCHRAEKPSSGTPGPGEPVPHEKLRSMSCRTRGGAPVNQRLG